jgi:4-hydroxy-tetrahydrodipicolinate synthase
VVSVLSNLFPADMMNAYRLFLGGKPSAAACILRHLHKTARLLFAETNPAPVKAALSILGLIENELRLPMTPVSAPLYESIAEELSVLGA